MKGILFKPDNIQAIIEGRKTQTRRVIKPQPELDAGGYYWNFYSKDGGRIRVTFDVTETSDLIKYARYQVGEVVYIKEAVWIDQSGGLWGYKGEMEWPPSNCGGKGYSPMFMPAWAARYFIEITDVRPERLQEITLEDIYDEGIDVVPSYDRIDAYKRLWDTINKPPYDWNSNCWVFVYSFKKVTNIDWKELDKARKEAGI